MGNALMRGDILGCLRCVATFAPVLLAPGYCAAWVSNLLRFRSRPADERLAWGVALSFALAPIAAMLLGKYGSFSAVCWLAGLCGAGFLAIAFSEFRRRSAGSPDKSRRIALAVAVAWILFVVAELIDIPVGDRLYLSVTVFDHALRTAFVGSVLHTGIPPANPLYWPGHAAPMRYYYFWYVLTAVAAHLAGATARQAIIASAVWAGFGLAAILALYCRYFLTESPSGGDLFRSGRRWPRFALALVLLAVTGLDVLPALVKAILRLPADGDMEWWSSDQVASWMDSLIWVPHHIAGLICCLLGFLLVWLSTGLSLRQRFLCGLVAGSAFASAFGLSTWVASAFAMVLLMWMVWVLVCERESRPRVPVLLGAGLVAVLALTPYLNELRSAPSNAATVGAPQPTTGGSIAGSAAHLLRFGVRRIIDPDSILALPWFARSTGPHAKLVGTAAGVLLELLLLIPGYFVELGFFGLILAVALRAARQRRLDQPLRTALFLVAAGLLVTTFLRSTVISNNDFGWRSALIAQFFLLLIAVRWCEGAFDPIGRHLRLAILAMVWIGLAGTAHQAIGLRLYLPVEDKLGRPDEASLSEHAMALRRASDAMQGRVSNAAILQYNTAQPSDFFNSAQILYVGRQVATASPGCESAFGGEQSACPAMEQSVSRLFVPLAGAALSAAEARVECAQLGASYLVATRWDGVWYDPRGWVWTLPAAVDTGSVRVVGCTNPPE